MFGMVLSVTWFEFEDLMYDPLDEREPVSVSCNRLTNDSLETKKNKAHTPGNIQATVPYVVGSLLISECISHGNKGNNYLSPKINEQHKKESRKDMPWDRHKYVEVLNWLIGSPSPL